MKQSLVMKTKLYRTIEIFSYLALVIALLLFIVSPFLLDDFLIVLTLGIFFFILELLKKTNHFSLYLDKNNLLHLKMKALKIKLEKKQIKKIAQFSSRDLILLEGAHVNQNITSIMIGKNNVNILGLTVENVEDYSDETEAPLTIETIYLSVPNFKALIEFFKTNDIVQEIKKQAKIQDDEIPFFAFSFSQTALWGKILAFCFFIFILFGSAVLIFTIDFTYLVYNKPVLMLLIMILLILEAVAMFIISKSILSVSVFKDNIIFGESKTIQSLNILYSEITKF